MLAIMATPSAGAFAAGRAFGIPIRIHWSLPAMIAYLTWMFAHAFAALPGPHVLPPSLWGLFVAVGLFVGVLLHELGHALTARALGVPVRGILLNFVGGVSELDDRACTGPREAWIALSGPLVNLVLCLLALAARALVPAALGELRLALALAANVNLIVGLFNLLPAFPLDGGRVLRALLTLRWNRARATSIAAGVAKLVAAALAIMGALGAWVLLLLAAFVWFAAERERRACAIRAALDGWSARALSAGEPFEPRIDGAATLADLCRRMVDEQETCYLVMGNGELLGEVCASDIDHVPAMGRQHLRVADAARPIIRVAADASASDALLAMDEAGARLAVLVENGTRVGILHRTRLLRAAQLDALAVHPPPGAVPRPHLR
jgi:Zn-dependent protease